MSASTSPHMRGVVEGRPQRDVQPVVDDAGAQDLDAALLERRGRKLPAHRTTFGCVGRAHAIIAHR